MFADLIYNYYLVVHITASLSLQWVQITKELIWCTFNTIQKIFHSVRTAFGDSKSTYVSEIWTFPCNDPPRGLGQGNWAAHYIWDIFGSPLIN